MEKPTNIPPGFGKVYEKEHAESILQGETKRILKNVGLTDENLQHKRIVDIGAGERLVAAYCMKNELTNEVYSVDPNIGKYPHDRKFLENNFPDIEKEVRKKSVIGKKENLPFKDDSFDYAVIHGVFMDHELTPEDFLSEEKAIVKKIVEETVRILKEGGETRVWPFYRENKKYEIWNKILLDVLSELELRGVCETSFESAPAVSRGEEIPCERIIIKKL